MAMTIDGSNGITLPNGTTQNTTGQPTLMTAVASTSGTSIDFTGIPSWVKRVTVMFDGVSTSGASPIIVQIGDAGGIEITGYNGSVSNIASTVASQNLSSGFAFIAGNAGYTYYGGLTISQMNLLTNLWIGQGVAGCTGVTMTMISGGTKSLSATLDRVRITTANGTDTFDAGTINVMYE